VQRFIKGDTVLLSIDAFNRLAAANELKFELSVFGAENKSIILIDSVLNQSHFDEILL
jgi:hypothetical protein